MKGNDQAHAFAVGAAKVSDLVHANLTRRDRMSSRSSSLAQSDSILFLMFTPGPDGLQHRSQQTEPMRRICMCEVL